mgnify:CR=1 FL=1
MKTSRDILILVLAFALGVIWMVWLQTPSDDTEPKPIDTPEFTVEYFNGGRLLTDNVTGCQYISEYNVGITPRMYSDGIQVCGQSTYPNGEHEHE